MIFWVLAALTLLSVVAAARMIRDALTCPPKTTPRGAR